MKTFIYRVIDANFNRAREGLRVCEEFVRFFLNDKNLTEDFKKIRNQIGRIYANFFKHKKLLFSARDVRRDVGRIGFPFEKKRPKPIDVFWANLQRAKEALRVLEEFSKLADEKFSDDFKKLRFKIYEVEKKAFKKLHDAIRDCQTK